MGYSQANDEFYGFISPVNGYRKFNLYLDLKKGILIIPSFILLLFWQKMEKLGEQYENSMSVLR